MKHLFAACLLLIFTLAAFTTSAQIADSIYYYDMSGNPAKPSAAHVISVSRKEDSGWLRMDYYTYSKKVKQVGHYLDHDFKIKNGEFSSYYANEQLHEVAYYKDNLGMGLTESFYSNGMMRDSCKLTNNLPTGNCTVWYPDGAVKQIFQMDSLGNGSGVIVGYFPNGVVSFKGKLLKGMRKTGAWTYYHENGNKASILKFPTIDETTLNQAPELKLDTLEGIKYDSLIEYSTATCFNEDGVEQAGCEIKNSLPQFKGGIPKWIDYLTNKMYGLANEYLKDNRAISYDTYFTVNTDGKITEALLSNKIVPVLDRTILNIFVGSNKWTPAMHNNRKIPYMRVQSLNLTPISAEEDLKNMPGKPRQVIRTEMITVPMGDGNRSGNPLNKNQFQ
jgi:antitoxin component YwqK of YwqJK toxin-antitoxin module